MLRVVSFLKSALIWKYCQNTDKVHYRLVFRALQNNYVVYLLVSHYFYCYYISFDDWDDIGLF